MNLVEKARYFALSEHEGQTYGNRPYSEHLREVAEIARRWGPEAEAAAWLHDVLEDTETMEHEIREEFPKTVAAIVCLVTDADADNRKTRKRLTYERLSFLPDTGTEGLALLVKLADRLANVRNCVATRNWGLLTMYRREHKAFKEAIYRVGQPRSLWGELDGYMKRRKKR
jgi:(p)ppGpp synthase/HD superfamily hydrolase